MTNYEGLVSLLLDADERMGGGTYHQEAADAIVSLRNKLSSAEAERDRALENFHYIVGAPAATVDTLRQDLAAARADAARQRHDLNDMRAGHEVLARQLSISRELLVECAQAILPPWQNPDDPLWSLKSRIVSTFAGQQSIDAAIAGEKK